MLSTRHSYLRLPQSIHTPSKRCHLFELPDHLLTRILSYFIPADQHIILEYDSWHDRHLSPNNRAFSLFCSSLLLINKAITTKCLDMIYNQNHFQFCNRYNWLKVMVQKLGNSRNHMHHLHLNGATLASLPNPHISSKHLGAFIVANFPNIRSIRLNNVGRGKYEDKAEIWPTRSGKESWNPYVWDMSQLRQINSIAKLPGPLFKPDVWCSINGCGTKLVTKGYRYEPLIDEVAVDIEEVWAEQERQLELRRKRQSTAYRQR